ncbi:putative metal-dependent membrane protease [Mycobacterium sp. JS623]|uniref:Rv0804 family intramembrane glutamic endopeptidase n=1 Tax=Mycobacterium sp. JS623 TaxID=212767 RepID=UPI0002A559AA|nr:CPBP family intramembrane glutamic endopeptidase [Mycobacterium sp. JS623]AGB25812.1 putative metal-dependent membrane protease [Mycobacterium sp. JS623]
MRPSKLRAVGLAAAMVGWSFAAPRVRWHPIPNASLGTGLVAVTRSPLGLRPPALWSGIRYGVVAGGAAALGVFAISTLPPVRRAMAVRDLPEHRGRWLLLSIPIGTVWPEEAAYRAALGTVAESAFGPTRGRLLQAAAFGLWHIVDARVTGQPVLGTVVFTGIGGWLFGWLHARSGSLAAPMLAHLAVNEAAGLAALGAQRRARRPGSPADGRSTD